VVTIRELLAEGRRELARPGIEAPGREANLLLKHLLGMTEAALLAHDRRPVPSAQVERFRSWVHDRRRGAPAAYLLGEREFWGRSFAVDRRVLIPRPESEHLVELALALALTSRARVLDVGTGSGCLAVTLAAERPDWRVVASDVSPAALAVARANARRHGVAARLSWLAADLAAAVELGAFDLVLSNPPYVAPDDAPGLAAEIRDHEPPLALFAGDGGTAVARRLLAAARALAPGAALALEVGSGQAERLRSTVAAEGGWELITTCRDLAGVERALLWRRGG